MIDSYNEDEEVDQNELEAIPIPFDK